MRDNPEKWMGPQTVLTPDRICLPSSHRSIKVEKYEELTKDVASIKQRVTKLKPLRKEMGARVCGGGGGGTDVNRQVTLALEAKPFCELYNIGKTLPDSHPYSLLPNLVAYLQNKPSVHATMCISHM